MLWFMYYCCSFLLLYFYLILISFYLLLFCLFWHWNLHAEAKLNKVVVFRYLHIQSELACSRNSDRGDNAKRCEQEKKKRGAGVGVKAKNLLSPSPSFPPYFFSLSSFAPHSTIRTPGTGYKYRHSLGNWFYKLFISGYMKSSAFSALNTNKINTF